MSVRLRDLDPAIFLHRVGIGTDQPAELLDVVGGNVRIGKTTNGRLTIEDNSGVVKVQLDSAGGSYIKGGQLHVATGNSSNNKYRTTTDTPLIVEAPDGGGSYIQMIADANQPMGIIMGDATDTARGALFYDENGGGFVMKAGGYSRLFVNLDGRVGIKDGSSSTPPTLNYGFTVNSALTASMLVGSTTGNRALIVFDGASNGDGMGGDYAWIAHESSGRFAFGNEGAGGFTFDGKVGIGTGTSSPVLALDIRDASFQIRLQTTANDAYVYLFHDGDSCGFNSSYGTTAGVKPIDFILGGSTPKVRFDPTGKVGIGTGTGVPTAKLDVHLSQQTWLNQYSSVHFGSQQHTANHIMGITLGYRETNDNYAYKKVGLVAEGLGDNAARQSFHILVDTVNDGNSVDVNDTKLSINGITGNVGVGPGIRSTPLQSSLNISGGTVSTICKNNTSTDYALTEYVALISNSGGHSAKNFSIADITRDVANYHFSNYVLEIFGHYPTGGCYAKYFIYYAYTGSGVITIQQPVGVNNNWTVSIQGEQTISGNIKRASIIVQAAAYYSATIRLTHSGVSKVDSWTSSNQNWSGAIKYNL